MSDDMKATMAMLSKVLRTIADTIEDMAPKNDYILTNPRRCPECCAGYDGWKRECHDANGNPAWYCNNCGRTSYVRPMS